MKNIFKLNEVWVVFEPNERDLNEIYLVKKDADKVCEDKLKAHYEYYKKAFNSVSDENFDIQFNTVYKHNLCIVITLNDALEIIKDYIEEMSTEQDESW